MPTDQLNEVALFQQFLMTRTANGNGPTTLQEALQQFSDYQRELADLRAKLHVAEQQSAAGQTAPFDAAATKSAVRARLAEKGIPD
jgi:hypothetical protein